MPSSSDDARGSQVGVELHSASHKPSLAQQLEEKMNALTTARGQLQNTYTTEALQALLGEHVEPHGDARNQRKLKKNYTEAHLSLFDLLKKIETDSDIDLALIKQCAETFPLELHNSLLEALAGNSSTEALSLLEKVENLATPLGIVFSQINDAELNLNFGHLKQAVQHFEKLCSNTAIGSTDRPSSPHAAYKDELCSLLLVKASKLNKDPAIRLLKQALNPGHELYNVFNTQRGIFKPNLESGQNARIVQALEALGENPTQEESQETSFFTWFSR